MMTEKYTDHEWGPPDEDTMLGPVDIVDPLDGAEIGEVTDGSDSDAQRAGVAERLGKLWSGRFGAEARQARDEAKEARREEQQAANIVFADAVADGVIGRLDVEIHKARPRGDKEAGYWESVPKEKHNALMAFDKASVLARTQVLGPGSDLSRKEHRDNLRVADERYQERMEKRREQLAAEEAARLKAKEAEEQADERTDTDSAGTVNKGETQSEDSQPAAKPDQASDTPQQADVSHLKAASNDDQKLAARKAEQLKDDDESGRRKEDLAQGTNGSRAKISGGARPGSMWPGAELSAESEHSKAPADEAADSMVARIRENHGPEGVKKALGAMTELLRTDMPELDQTDVTPIERALNRAVEEDNAATPSAEQASTAQSHDDRPSDEERVSRGTASDVFKNVMARQATAHETTQDSPQNGTYGQMGRTLLDRMMRNGGTAERTDETRNDSDEATDEDEPGQSLK